MEFKNWAYVEVGPRGELLRTGHIIDKLSEGVYLVQVHAGEMTRAEPVKAEEMMRWKLFPDQLEMKRFVQANQAAAAKAAAEGKAAADATAETPPNGDEPTTLDPPPDIERVPEKPTVTKPGNKATPPTVDPAEDPKKKVH